MNDDREREDMEKRFPILNDPSLSGETNDPVADHVANQTLRSIVSAEGFVENYYTRIAPGFLAAHVAVSCLPELQHIAEQAVERDHEDFT